MKVRIVCGPRRTKAGVKPLKNPDGPTLAISRAQCIMLAYSPGLAFIKRVFSTSRGIVSNVAMAPALNEAVKCVATLSLKYWVLSS